MGQCRAQAPVDVADGVRVQTTVVVASTKNGASGIIVWYTRFAVKVWTADTLKACAIVCAQNLSHHAS